MATSNRPPGLKPSKIKAVYFCQVDGCRSKLNNCKPYCVRYRVCHAHLAAASVQLQNQECRFCQQCGKFHPLEEFDGTKRSCRSRLQHHNSSRMQRRKEAQLQQCNVTTELLQHRRARQAPKSRKASTSGSGSSTFSASEHSATAAASTGTAATAAAATEDTAAKQTSGTSGSVSPEHEGLSATAGSAKNSRRHDKHKMPGLQAEQQQQQQDDNDQAETTAAAPGLQDSAAAAATVAMDATAAGSNSQQQNECVGLCSPVAQQVLAAASAAGKGAAAASPRLGFVGDCHHGSSSFLLAADLDGQEPFYELQQHGVTADQMAASIALAATPGAAGSTSQLTPFGSASSTDVGPAPAPPGIAGSSGAAADAATAGAAADQGPAATTAGATVYPYAVGGPSGADGSGNGSKAGPASRWNLFHSCGSAANGLGSPAFSADGSGYGSESSFQEMFRSHSSSSFVPVDHHARQPIAAGCADGGVPSRDSSRGVVGHGCSMWPPRTAACDGPHGPIGAADRRAYALEQYGRASCTTLDGSLAAANTGSGACGLLNCRLPEGASNNTHCAAAHGQPPELLRPYQQQQQCGPGLLQRVEPGAGSMYAAVLAAAAGRSGHAYTAGVGMDANQNYLPAYLRGQAGVISTYDAVVAAASRPVNLLAGTAQQPQVSGGAPSNGAIRTAGACTQLQYSQDRQQHAVMSNGAGAFQQYNQFRQCKRDIQYLQEQLDQDWGSHCGLQQQQQGVEAAAVAARGVGYRGSSSVSDWSPTESSYTVMNSRTDTAYCGAIGNAASAVEGLWQLAATDAASEQHYNAAAAAAGAESLGRHLTVPDRMDSSPSAAAVGAGAVGHRAISTTGLGGARCWTSCPPPGQFNLPGASGGVECSMVDAAGSCGPQGLAAWSSGVSGPAADHAVEGLPHAMQANTQGMGTAAACGGAPASTPDKRQGQYLAQLSIAAEAAAVLAARQEPQLQLPRLLPKATVGPAATTASHGAKQGVQPHQIQATPGDARNQHGAASLLANVAAGPASWQPHCYPGSLHAVLTNMPIAAWQLGNPPTTGGPAAGPGMLGPAPDGFASTMPGAGAVPGAGDAAGAIRTCSRAASQPLSCPASIFSGGGSLDEPELDDMLQVFGAGDDDAMDLEFLVHASME